MKPISKTDNYYDILLQNNATREVFILNKVISEEETRLFIRFESVVLPQNAPNGEYTYAVIKNLREDVRYTPKADFLDTLAEVDDKSYTLRDLKAITGLLRVGEVEDSAVYQEKAKNKNYYYKSNKK